VPNSGSTLCVKKKGTVWKWDRKSSSGGGRGGGIGGMNPDIQRFEGWGRVMCFIYRLAYVTFVVDKWHWAGFSLGTTVFACQYLSTNAPCLVFIHSHFAHAVRSCGSSAMSDCMLVLYNLYSTTCTVQIVLMLREYAFSHRLYLCISSVQTILCLYAEMFLTDNFYSLHPRVCIDNLNEIRSVLRHCFLYKVVQIWPGQTVTCLHTNQSRSYLNHLVFPHFIFQKHYMFRLSSELFLKSVFNSVS
jgi:hypothetical protein